MSSIIHALMQRKLVSTFHMEKKMHVSLHHGMIDQ